MARIRTTFKETGFQLKRIIAAYRREKPSYSETTVEYANGSISSFNIEGELGQNSIPDKTNAVKVEIGSTVTSIGNDAFFRCFGLTSATIPDSVTSIGHWAFDDCYGLTSIIIPDSVTSIAEAAFQGCSGLTTITIPDGVTSIEDDTFSGCTGLTSITIGNSVTSIGDGTFANCPNLISITIPDSVTSIGSLAFYYCSGLSSIISLRTSAPTVQSDTFGKSNFNYMGWNSRLTSGNVLKIPQGATGYDTGAWLDPLQNANKCGFHIEYIASSTDTVINTLQSDVDLGIDTDGTI